jgi:hypothetical protein
MDRDYRRPRDEGSGSIIKRSTRKSTSSLTEDNNTSTRRVDENHFGSKEVTHGD